MWAKVAEEMQVPWRAAEAMHWQLGEADMARRAGVTPFSLTATTIEASSSGHHRRSPSHLSYQQHPQAHGHHHSQGGFRPDTGSAGGSSSSGALSPRYGRSGNPSMPLPPPPMSMHGDRLASGLGMSSSSSSGRGFGSSSGRRERGSTPGRGGSSFGGAHQRIPLEPVLHQATRTVPDQALATAFQLIRQEAMGLALDRNLRHLLVLLGNAGLAPTSSHATTADDISIHPGTTTAEVGAPPGVAFTEGESDE
ncbi:hypothetical protein Sste5346_005790 [Sporothrix stenoceras]|uniref:Uncharacterized protein n=1 Tax=Sporothrix stenoceras TaxID=5173 RepID=A0ABR3Z3B9_9PEZI